MRDEDVAPDPQLMESLRSVGYTLETAIADIIDNSIAAGGNQVDVKFAAEPEPRIAVIDNGSGMDRATLLQAMRLAGRPATDKRQAHDLGRFGLGLKTASLSQARCVTVATKTKASKELQAVRWDLQHLKTTGRWSLQILDDAETKSLAWIDSLESHDAGTLVLWEDLDQLHITHGQAEAQLDDHMERVRDHLKLVFHRFVSSKMKPLSAPLTIRINGGKLPTVDPFLKDHLATQWGPRETFKVEGKTVEIRPFTLPYISKLTRRDREAALLAGTLRDSQGFYVYRAGRLVLWGTWFRIFPRDELGKLARVQVDIPNSLDHLWALDIKKSAASPPPEIRRRLRQIAGEIVKPSRKVHTFKGTVKHDADKVERIWNLVADRDNEFRYEVNRNHPLVSALSESLEGREGVALANLLRAIESTFPVEDAYVRLGSDNSHIPQSTDVGELREMVRQMYGSSQFSVAELTLRLKLIEPFSSVKDLENLLKDAFDE